MSLTVQAIRFGPLVLPWTWLIAFTAITCGIWTGIRHGKRRGVDTAPVLYRLVLIGVVAARLGFVWQLRAVYFAHPLDIIDIRDGGWAIEVGLIAACLYGLYRTRSHSALRKPLMVAGGVAMAISIVGTASLVALPQTDRTLPTDQLMSIDGHEIALTAFVGKPTVINLWASWCPPCRHEMPVLESAQAAYPGVNFVFVNQGENKATIDAYLDTEHLALRNMLLDARMQTGNALGYQAMPTTLFFDSKGKLFDTRIGALSPATLLQHLNALHGTPIVPSTNELKATP